jgi:hypothetical protein
LTGTKQFGFPVNYQQLEIYYRYYFQISNQWNLQTNFFELSKVSSEKLQEKPTLIIAFYGWMAHADMVKLREFIIHGGTLISLGDIPHLNEYFEEDTTLDELYRAECMSESSENTCVWMNDATTQDIDNIECLYEYRLLDQNNLKILAHDGEFQHTYAFARDIEEGRIIHTGIMLPPILESLPHFLNLLELTNFTSKYSSASKECLLFQLVCPSGERLAVVGNFQSNPLYKVSLLFNHPQMERFNPIEITNMCLPAQIVMIWMLEYFIAENIVIEYATAELTQKQHLNSQEWDYFFYAPFRNEQPHAHLIKLAFRINKPSIQTEIFPATVKSQKKNITGGYQLSIEYPETFKINILDGTIRYQFHFIPYALTGDL